MTSDAASAIISQVGSVEGLQKYGRSRVEEIAAALNPADEQAARDFVADVYGEEREPREYAHDEVVGE